MELKSYFVFSDYIPTDIYPIQYGEEQCKPRHSFGPCVRGNYIIHYVYSGRGILKTENKEYTVNAGQMFLIKPNRLAYYEADSENPWHYRWAEFNGSMAEKIVAAFKEPVMDDDCEKNAGRALEKLVSCGNTRFEVLMQKFWDFAAALTENAPEPRTSSSEEYIKKAELFIKNNVHKKITVSDTARHIGINRSYLSRLFAEHKGISPQQYILTIKMNTAAQYLKNTDISVADAAASVGYSDYHVFNKAFKNQFNTSPSSWRKKRDWEQYILM